MTPIPRSPEDWAAITPNETDREIESPWRKRCPADYDCYRRLAAASRLHEQERCVEELRRSLERMEWNEAAREARRMLGCEPESGEKGVG